MRNDNRLLRYHSTVESPEATVGARRGMKTERQRDGDMLERLECKTRQKGSDNTTTM